MGNYINHVQELWSGINWRYEPFGEDPADGATRGAAVRMRTIFGGLAHQVISYDQVSSEDNPNSLYLHCHTIHVTSTCFVEEFSSLNRLLTAMTRCRPLLQHKMTASPYGDMRPSYLTNIAFFIY